MAGTSSSANIQGNISSSSIVDIYDKVTVEIQEGSSNPPSSFTGLKLETPEELCDSETQSAETVKEHENLDVHKYGSYGGAVTVENVPDAAQSQRAKRHKERNSKAKMKLHKNSYNSQLTNTTKINLRSKENQAENIDSEVNVDDRFNESTEPEIKIHCKAKYIKLKPISKCDLEGKDLYIEVEIDNDLTVSPIEKYESSLGKKSKYTFKISMAKTVNKPLKRKSQSKDSRFSDNEEIEEKVNSVQNPSNSNCRSMDLDSKSMKKKVKRKKSGLVEAKDSVQMPADSLMDYNADTETEDHVENEAVLTESGKSDTSSAWHKDIKKELEEKQTPRADQTDETTELKIRKKSKRKTRKKPCSTKKQQTKSIDYSTRVTEDGLKLFGCPLCKYESKYSQNIRSHYLIHTKVKPWICDVCGSAFVSKCNLRHHMISHSDDRPFKCQTCGMGFKQKVVLQQHVARHNEDRQYVCDHCGKGFCISGDLKKHIRTHTGEKPYTCEVCFKQFSDNSSLARHRYLHNEEKKFSCQKCDKRFARRDMCNSHMKTHCNGNQTAAKSKKGNVKRTRKEEVGNVIEEAVEVEVENRDAAPREHLYHIENYAKEIQERTYTDMDVSRVFSVTNYPQQQQPQQTVQGYQQRNDPNVQQDGYPRDYTAMWPNLHFY